MLWDQYVLLRLPVRDDFRARWARTPRLTRILLYVTGPALFVVAIVACTWGSVTGNAAAVAVAVAVVGLQIAAVAFAAYGYRYKVRLVKPRALR